ncbi:hypothetical protein EPUL_003072 [Erysiphe pulchra]|uniref:Endonuclease/exonuclease/phosphatase domain-containing protein n=1 Tax=Erysiphe pulchra TaxID=225359 RepID=A0A2S4PQQ2_9PEZI|nr:hypothetical protein EPUL_003072 [Erysiphe pulchra]
MAFTLHAAAIERPPTKTMDPQYILLLHVRRQLGVAIAEYHVEVRAKAAVVRVEAVAVAAEPLPTIDKNNEQAVISTNEVSISEAFFEETIPETQLQMAPYGGGSTHDVALSRVYELDVDVILIQEPWWSNITKSHPAIAFPLEERMSDLGRSHTPAKTTSKFSQTKFSPLLILQATTAGRSYGQGEEIETWAETQNLSCLLIGEPTNRARNTLDLAWSNIPGTQVWVDRTDCMTSDHLPLRGIVSTLFLVISTPPSPICVTRSNIPKFARIAAQWASPPPH